MIPLKSLLTEIVSNPIIELGKYLQSSDEDKAIELIYDIFSEKIYAFIDDNFPQLSEKINSFPDGVEACEWLEQNDPQIFKQFAKFVFEETRDVDLYDYTTPGHPTWNYMEFRGYLKNRWLIHFSDNAKQIWLDQTFKIGMDDYTSLGLTTEWKDTVKSFGGYNFAYDINEFVRYGRSRFHSRGWKYGKEAVMFKASGVRVWHYGDEEPQVIFWGATAKNIVHIQYTGESDWGVMNDKVGNYIYREDLPKVTQWVVNNFDQYKKVLLP